jgi:hypothetical protein
MNRPTRIQTMDFCRKKLHRSCVGARLGLDVDIVCRCKCHDKQKGKKKGA